MGRNHTGPPSVSAARPPTRLARRPPTLPAGRPPGPARRGRPAGSVTDPDRRQRQTTDASEQNNTGPLGGSVTTIMSAPMPKLLQHSQLHCTGDSMDFRRIFSVRKLRVPGLWYRVVCVILGLAVLVELPDLWRTDRRKVVIYYNGTWNMWHAERSFKLRSMGSRDFAFL